ncbi:MAG: SRPBCC family protein [Dehalococcoidia bacterium]
MTVEITAETTIARSRHDVAAFATDPANDRRWIGGITEVHAPDEPVAQGVRVARVAKFMGRRIEYVNEIMEYEPESRLAMRSVQAPFPMEVTYEFEDAGGGATRMRIRTGGDVGRFYGFLSPVLGFFLKRSVSRDLRALKRILESD